MHLHHPKTLHTAVAQPHFQIKLVFNAAGGISIPAATEHRDAKAAGISYEDNYRGNALAAMVMPGRIEVRYHMGFTDAQVAAILRELLALPELAGMRGCTATYQGRPLNV